MKRIRFFALLLSACLCLGAAAARAEEWSEEYYRAWDTASELTDARRDDLDTQCLDFVSRWRLDLAMIGVRRQDYAGKSLREFAEEYYSGYGFGYGDTRDGFLLVYDMDAEEAAELLAFGAAEDAVDEVKLEAIAESSVGYREEYGVWGVMYAVYRQLANAMEAMEETETTETGTAAAETLPEAAPSAAGMPDWYPADPQHFTFFQDENAPRTVDDADIFTAAEEQSIEKRLTELRRELDRDIVVFTDDSTHGLSRAVYAADFYDFNGYGCGSEREGLCLFICMEPGNRGFWTCATGPDSRALYTEDAANRLDDALYEYMSAGEYAAGVLDWIEHVRSLYVKGYPLAPDWYPDRDGTFERFHNRTAPRVVDEAGLLSAAEAGLLNSRAIQMSMQYHLDIVLITSSELYGMPSQEYADEFYLYNGYGYGESYDGILLGVFETKNYSEPWSRITASGRGAEKLSETNEERLCGRCDNVLSGGSCYRAMDEWLDQVEHMLRTGRVPRSAASWALTGCLGVLAGSLFGGLSLFGAKRRMSTRLPRVDADEYLVPNTLRVEALRDDFVGTTTSRRYSPPPRESDSGGGGSFGGSSYSGSYSGSSGASHSGSGRDF